LICLLALATACGGAGAETSSEHPSWIGEDELEPVIYELDNGMTVILQEDHHAPVVAVQIWVAVGSADERPEEAGLAHVHEHMLFKGTEQRGVGEIAST
jgi:predicted Zn-dependent peptidase